MMKISRTFLVMFVCMAQFMLTRVSAYTDVIVVDYEKESDLDKIVGNAESAVLHFYNRKDKDFKDMKRMFRKAAKMDYDRVQENKILTNKKVWVSINF